jgi:hypothetical protein
LVFLRELRGEKKDEGSGDRVKKQSLQFAVDSLQAQLEKIQDDAGWSPVNFKPSTDN